NRPVLELDLHGPAAPQVIGAIMAAAQLPPSGRNVAFRFVDAAVARPGTMPEGIEIRRQYEGLPGARPPAPGEPSGRATGGRDAWQGIPSERRWAMEVLGLHAGFAIERDDVQQRFRRLVRLAHPDHGAGSAGAAERIAELAEARELLLAVIASAGVGRAG
ncbi:MAG: J domain-containing protein, partial [Acidimicrobiia bacterium]